MQSAPLSAHYQGLLEQALAERFLPHLPVLLDLRRPVEEQRRKNLSRALGAFALRGLCEVGVLEAAASVIDDFDDQGIDAIYLSAATGTLFVVQSKLRSGEQFNHDDALAFGQGVRKLVVQDLDSFNKNVQDRRLEIEDAIEHCTLIQLVVVFVGPGVSGAAAVALSELVEGAAQLEERLSSTIIFCDATCVTGYLHDAGASKRVDADLALLNPTKVENPRLTHFGLVPLVELVKLHQVHGEALYDKNIRTFLGTKTDVNVSIASTIMNEPAEFLYRNNGVAMLCEKIVSRGVRLLGAKKKLHLEGLSVINGAQTIASAARCLDDDPNVDLSSAMVSLTLIQSDANSDFGKSVTRARNHQNPVAVAQFAALDDQQERLRRELAHLAITYTYKTGVATGLAAGLRIEEAAHALALFQADPRFAIWLKKEPARLLETGSEQYKVLFSPVLTGFHLANAVRFARYADRVMWTAAAVASGQERLTYRHGRHAFGWVLAHRVAGAQSGAHLLDGGRLEAVLSSPSDALRQALFEETSKLLGSKGPLSFFRSQADVVPLLDKLVVRDFGLQADPVVQVKRNQQNPTQPYPVELFKYLLSKAPQIGGLA